MFKSLDYLGLHEEDYYLYKTHKKNTYLVKLRREATYESKDDTLLNLILRNQSQTPIMAKTYFQLFIINIFLFIISNMANDILISNPSSQLSIFYVLSTRICLMIMLMLFVSLVILNIRLNPTYHYFRKYLLKHYPCDVKCPLGTCTGVDSFNQFLQTNQLKNVKLGVPLAEYVDITKGDFYVTKHGNQFIICEDMEEEK